MFNFLEAKIILDAISKDLLKVGKEVDKVLLSYFNKRKISQKRLNNSLVYSAIGSGKRLRAFLVIESAKLISKSSDINAAYQVAAALELIHTYSLVHDDLPSMDNSLLRRGKPTAHITYDEATAILLGDGLQSLAFEMISDTDLGISSDIALLICNELSKSIGFKGMVGGQMMDLISEGRYEEVQIDQEYILNTQKLKTGALIVFALKAGGLIGGANDLETDLLSRFGENIGLAFQIVDDVLDCESSEVDLGKPVNIDNNLGKTTFVSVLGVEKSKEKVSKLINEAKMELNEFGNKAEKLLKLADFVETRKN